MSARALYYTPTTQGLKSFRCTVDFDWKDFLTRYSGADVKDDNPSCNICAPFISPSPTT